MLMSSPQSSGFGLDSNYSSILPATRVSHLIVHLPFTSQLPTDTHTHTWGQREQERIFLLLGLKK